MEGDEFGRRDRGGRGRFDRGDRMKPNYFMPKPIKVGDVIEVTIEATASKGDGIAKKDGFVIFVKGAKQGDKVTIKITDVKARFGIGELVSGGAASSSESPASPEEGSDSNSEEEA
jgi:predicted RNA-binding protein with TRAM domain